MEVASRVLISLNCHSCIANTTQYVSPELIMPRITKFFTPFSSNQFLYRHEEKNKINENKNGWKIILLIGLIYQIIIIIITARYASARIWVRSIADCRDLSATVAFTIKQCDRVTDAWNVVCGPGLTVPPLSLLNSFSFFTTHTHTHSHMNLRAWHLTRSADLAHFISR